MRPIIESAVADELRKLDGGLDVALVDLDPQAGLTGYAKRAPSADPVRDAPTDVHGIPLYRGGRALARASEEEITAHLERALAAGAVLLEPDTLSLARALAVVQYHQERNYAASCSHAARTAARHKRRRRRKPQVSL